MDIRFIRDGTRALLEYDTDEFTEDDPLSSYHLDRYFTGEEYSDWLRLSFSISTNEHEKEVLEHIVQLEEFTRKQIEDPSFSKGFIWESKQQFNWFDNVPLLIEYFEQRQEELGTETLGPFPFVCKYAQHAPTIASAVTGKLARFYLYFQLHFVPCSHTLVLPTQSLLCRYGIQYPRRELPRYRPLWHSPHT